MVHAHLSHVERHTVLRDILCYILYVMSGETQHLCNSQALPGTASVGRRAREECGGEAGEERRSGWGILKTIRECVHRRRGRSEDRYF